MQFMLAIFIATTIALGVIVLFLLDMIQKLEDRLSSYRRKEIRDRIINKHVKEVKDKKYSGDVVKVLEQMKDR